MMKLLIANWKAYLTLQEITRWLDEFKRLVTSNKELTNAIRNKQLTIVICPPFPFISFVKHSLTGMSEIQIGAQTVSSQVGGKYTGEVTAAALKEFISYAIIGHSERRNNFNLSEAEISDQIKRCEEHSIIPLLCIRNENDTVYPEVNYVFYEPVEAIGSGKNADVQEVTALRTKLHLPETIQCMYGGSVDSQNVASYLKENITGFIVGTASLKAPLFYDLAVSML